MAVQCVRDAGSEGFLAHSLVGHQEYACADDSQSAQGHKDHGAGAAGFGQHGAGGVGNARSQGMGSSGSGGSAVDGRRAILVQHDSDVLGKLVVAGGSDGLLQAVSTGLQTVKARSAVSVGADLSGIGLASDPRDGLGSGITPSLFFSTNLAPASLVFSLPVAYLLMTILKENTSTSTLDLSKEFLSAGLLLYLSSAVLVSFSRCMAFSLTVEV